MNTKILLYAICSLFFSRPLLAQTPPATIVKQDYTLEPGQSQSYTATQSITLKPTTWIKAGSTFSAKVVSDAYIPIAVSNTQNYILTRSYQKAMTSPGGITENKDVIDQVVYYDGLGRPMQQVAIKASHDKYDLITHIGYDQFGRQAKEYLPYRASQNKGQFNGSALSGTNSFYNTAKYENTANPYSEKVFEPSPLNRVEEVGAPGNPWKANPASDTDHTIKHKYTTNGSGEVRQYGVDLDASYTPSLTNSPTHYAANELYITITKDENWKPADGNNRTTKEYKDKQGRVILKRAYNGGTAHDTYYVYDNYGNLTYVLPPKVNTGATITATVLNELCYQYKYDERNRLIEKKVPGKGWEYIVYNKLDQPVMTQDTKLKNQNKWLFTKYDAFGRVAYTGFHNSTSDRATLQGRANDTSAYKQYVTKTNTANTYATTPVYYNNATIPQGMAEIHTINYYDNYTFDQAGLTVPTSVLGQTVDTRTKTLATGNKTRVLGTNHWITTISAYDKKGRLIYTAIKNPYLNTTDIVEQQLDFAGKVLQTKISHTKGSNAAIVTVDRFEYDHMGRLLAQAQKVNNQAEELIAENVYDALGQLERKKVGNTKSKPLQTVNYAYNVRGWLTDINDVDNPAGKLFNFQINYNTPRSGAVPALFNGNIAETYWKTANDNTMRRYAYTYDALNRITSGKFNGSGQTDRYTVRGITYDKNGNIAKLTRSGAIVANPVPNNTSHYGVMDSLSYAYYNGGNFLIKVSDAANKTYGFKDGSNTDNDYGRDANGNTIRDKNKGITGITYNHLNLPTEIKFNNSDTRKINYFYGADGVKLKKVVNNAGDITTTDYNGSYVYENGSLKQVSHPEGYLEPKSGGGYQYVYRLTDIWGNTRVTYADDNGDGVVGVSEIRREQNYFPGGLEHRGYNGAMSGVKNNLKTYQGQEFTEDLSLNTHEWKYRVSDPATLRFWQIDPLAEDYYYNSTYAFAENKLGMGIELEGLEIQEFNNKDKKVQFFTPTYKSVGTIFSASGSIRGKVGPSVNIKASAGNTKASVGVSVLEAKGTVTTDPELKGQVDIVKATVGFGVQGLGKSEASVAVGQLKGSITEEGTDGEVSVGTYSVKATGGTGVTIAESGALLSSNEDINGKSSSSVKVQVGAFSGNLKGNKVGVGASVGPVSGSVSADVDQSKNAISNFFNKMFDLLINGLEKTD